MVKLKSNYNDEVDILEIFGILWRGKWKIITATIIFALVGTVLQINKENTFSVSTLIQNGKGSVFIDFKPINDVLNENELLLTDENLNGYFLDSSTIFQTFINEFNDYEEMISVLKNDIVVNNSIKKLDETSKNFKLIELAKLFKISNPVPNENNLNLPLISKVNFKWHDTADGMRLFEEAIMLTLKNVKTDLFNDIDKLATSIDMKNQRQLENLRIELSIIKKKQRLDNNIRIQYLSEQSAIAKEVGIKDNILDADALLQSSSLSLKSKLSTESNISLTINPNDFPYYLRGYKAIDKEISLIKNRTDDQQLLFASGYDEISKKILSLENDLSSSQLRSFLKSIENDNPNDWIEFNLALADSKSENNIIFDMILFIITGVALGVAYVLINNSFQMRKKSI